ncbi:MAG: hypothetical protein OIF55_07550, partial [Amphritea sp.]|nr:hypothetical protein [Amphritea sp.]
DELSALNAAQPGTYFGLGTDDLQAWYDQFKAIRDDQLRMFAELNEVKGWNLTFVAANECVDEMNGNATIGTGWIEYKYRNNCPAPVNILMQVEFDKNTAGDREQLYRTRLDPDEVFQRKFYAESDGSNSVTARLASCYDKQEGPSLYPDGKTYGCDWAFELDETDLVRDYRARRDSLVDHLDAVLSDVVGD